MTLAVGVAFPNSGKIGWFDPCGLELAEGDEVIVETEAGEEYGLVRAAPRERADDSLSLPLKQVRRKAAIDDLRRVNENKFREQQAFRTALEKIAQHGLPMKLIAVDSTFDRSKMVFHFVAENRVDFRELAKDLARTIRCRVELHQIGVRDEAKMLGGLGPCGRELCCCSFLNEFEPVGIKMAKEQDLSLNPQKISGVCGRLMCCLAFEFGCYREAKRGCPKVGARVETQHGPGRVAEINVVRGEVAIALEEGGGMRLTLAEAAKMKRSCPARAGETQAETEEEPEEEGESEEGADLVVEANGTEEEPV